MDGLSWSCGAAVSKGSTIRLHGWLLAAISLMPTLLLAMAGCAGRPFGSPPVIKPPVTQPLTPPAADAVGRSPASPSATTITPVSFQSPSQESFGQDSPASSDSVIQLAPQLEPVPFSEPMLASLPSTTMSLAEFEAIAFSNNPTLKQLASTTQKAAGFRTQVGLKANPMVGYQAQQLVANGTDQHLAFVEQEFVTGGKLELNRRVLNETVRAQLAELETQRIRVVTDIRVTFYAVLAAQSRIAALDEFQAVAEQAVELAELRREAAEGSKIDVLQAKVLKNEVDLARQQAQIGFEAAWRELAAIAGDPLMAPVEVVGELPITAETLAWEGVANSILIASPEYEVAQIRVREAQAAIARHEVQPIPNLAIHFAAGVDNGTETGLMNFQVGAPMPVHNRNQGNIAAAKADYCRAVMEVQRVENAIKARLAVVSRDFDAARAAVAKFSDEILPNAQESLELAEVAYKAGETSFVQVLVARQTYFDSNLKLIDAQQQLAGAVAKVEGYVLTGALDPINDNSRDASLRDLTFTQQ